MTNEATPPADQTAGNTPIAVLAQYVKDFSFENPNAPGIFRPTQSAPEMNIGVNIQTGVLSPNNYEVVLALKLDARLEGKNAFIAELLYAGVFALPQMPEESLRLFLLVEAPRLLFPFARGILASMVRDGGFPQIMIAPIDFMGLYLANKDKVGTMPAAGAA